MPSTFSITFDYLCPFSRIVNESIVEGLLAGEDWEVTFRPFSIAQARVEEGAPDVWERADGSAGTRGVLALQWSVAIRDEYPGAFLGFHVALYDAKHTGGVDIGDEAVLRSVVASVGLDPDAVAAIVSGGAPRKTLAVEHSELVEQWAVFGSPTFIVGEEAVFVRLMERHHPEDIPRLLELITWANLNEFKHTRVGR